jgi:peptidase S41-like protein/tricorn protease-like protein
MSTRKFSSGLRCITALAFVASLLVSSWQAAHALQQKKIDPVERERAEGMIAILHDALKKNYYDPTFHGVDMDARYKIYAERVKKSQSLAEALRTIAAYLAVLDDSHTVFIPPESSFRFDYGYRMQLIGDRCFITEVRPGSDAAQKLHSGDQVLSLDEYAVNRNDFWQLEYYLSALAPKFDSRFVLRDPSGTERREVIGTEYGRTERFRHRSVFDQMDLYEKWRHQMRNRSAELDDAVVWKMQAFFSIEGEIDRMISLARKHKLLILDLRGNGGGAVQTLRYLVSCLFDHEVHVGTNITRKGKSPLDVKPRDKGAFTGKLIVLVDARSASAAEILARVVQLDKRGTVMGDLTEGSVMEGQIFPFQYGLDRVIHFAASITIADLIMSDGKSLEKIGVTPDVLALPTAADLAAGRDPVLAKAAELAGVTLDPVAAGKMFPYEWPPD